MSIYPSLEEFKLDGLVAQNNNPSSNQTANKRSPHPSNMNEQSLRTLYPILHDYLGLKMDILAQKNSAVIPFQQPSVQAKYGARKLLLCEDPRGHEALKLSKFHHGIFVSYVGQNSPAYKGGLRVGHQILKINDVFVIGMSLDMVNKIFQICSVNNIYVIIRNRPLERSINIHKDRTGNVGFQLKNGKIISIVKGSSAAYNGLLTDHQILEVNGKYVTKLKDEEIEDIFKNNVDMITITIIPESIYNHMIKKLALSLDK